MKGTATARVTFQVADPRQVADRVKSRLARYSGRGLAAAYGGPRGLLVLL
jgi:hypothetical protein